jgi:uncharacterized protein (TIGR02453 family)
MMTLLHDVSVTTFAGFPPQTIHFLDELSHHNSREWFQTHRADYDAFYLQPARELVLAVGDKLDQLGPGLHAEPKVHGSILTINRDVRFSKDKSPFKTHLDLWFWHGDGPSRERPGYFLRLTASALTLGAGMHAFAEPALRAYRETILADDERAAYLDAIAAELKAHQSLQGQTYKRVPPGLPADHPRAHWLRYSGLFAETTVPLPRELFSPACADALLECWQPHTGLVQWLIELLHD